MNFYFSYPWQVWFFTPGGTCSGSIIHRRWIITAAHCCLNKQMAPPRKPWDKITITMGDYDKSMSGEAEVRLNVIFRYPIKLKSFRHFSCMSTQKIFLFMLIMLDGLTTLKKRMVIMIYAYCEPCCHWTNQKFGLQFVCLIKLGNMEKRVMYLDGELPLQLRDSTGSRGSWQELAKWLCWISLFIIG